MYIVDDICYAGEETPDIKVKEARALRGGMLLLCLLYTSDAADEL